MLSLILTVLSWGLARPSEQERPPRRPLQQASRRLAWCGHTCRLALINPGATDTDMIRHLNCKKIDPKEIAHAVELVLNNPYIKEITVYEK